jgi:Uma2 family endonuclease
MNKPCPLTESPQRATVRSAMGEPAKTKLSYEEFLKLYDEDTRAEWVDGEVILLSPASNRHQDLVSSCQRAACATEAKN